MNPLIDRLPELGLHLGGRPVAEDWRDTLEGLEVRARLGLPTQCELVFDTPGLAKVADAGWVCGASLRIEVRGQAAGSPSLFEGEVTGIEQIYAANGPRQVRIRAYDALFRLDTRQTVRGHRQLSVEDLARELVADLGLTVRSSEAGARRRLIAQHRQSDLELLRSHAGNLGLYAAVRGTELHLLTLEGSGEKVALKRGRNLFRSRFDVDGSRPRGGLVGLAWDPSDGKSVEGQVGQARSGPRVGQRRPSAGNGRFTFVDLGLEDSRQVESVCRAELDRAACREINFWGIAAGDGHLRPGVSVEIGGVDPALEGRYVLTSVLHSIDRQRGFVSELSSYPPKLEPMPTATTVVPGIVTSVEDPDRLGRVKASLPTFAEIETDWMRVVSPGLGGNKGFVALPDVDDQVAIALTHGDPARGLVLGGIFDGGGKLDPGVEGGRVRRFQLRAGDQVICLDEKRGSIRLENEAGSFVEMSSDGIVVRAAGDLRLEAPGKRLRLRAARIDMEKG